MATAGDGRARFVTGHAGTYSVRIWHAEMSWNLQGEMPSQTVDIGGSSGSATISLVVPDAINEF